jgi:hypothetical protein
MVGSEPLVCPSCASSFGSEERFCPNCHIPLVHAAATEQAGELDADDLRARARKIKRQYSEGDLVRVVGARNQVEAEFVQGMLLEEGIPSMLRRSAGFDVPDFLTAGPRDVLVPRSGVSAAREVLLQADLLPSAATGPSPLRVLVGLLLALALLALVAWIGTDVLV